MVQSKDLLLQTSKRLNKMSLSRCFGIQKYMIRETEAVITDAVASDTT